MDSGELEVFAAVANLRSFSAAARRLTLTTAAVSKAVARLEARLDTRLFTRTTRRVVPTSEGEELYA
ncbi:LysR family transcriptional regulator, partial [Acinetobacter baumannii]